MFSCVLKHSITQWFPNLVVLLITEKSADMTNDYHGLQDYNSKFE